MVCDTGPGGGVSPQVGGGSTRDVLKTLWEEIRGILGHTGRYQDILERSPAGYDITHRVSENSRLMTLRTRSRRAPPK